MGFSLRRAFKCVKNKVGNAIGRTVENIGSVIHSSAIEDAGFKLRVACDFGYTFWGESASVSRTVDVHKELNKVIESVTPQAAESESKLIDICIAEIGEILDQFISLIPVSDLYRLRENYQAEIRNQLSGQIMKDVQPKLSLDNAECKKVLEIDDDSDRQKQASEFKEKVLESAGQKFKGLCMNVKKGYCEKILDIADRELQVAQAECDEQNVLLERMLQDTKDEQMIDLEREQVLFTVEKLALLSAITFDQ